MLSSVQLGAMEAITLELQAREAGDYLYGDHREAYREAGMWGLLRVHERDTEALRSLGGP